MSDLIGGFPNKSLSIQIANSLIPEASMFGTVAFKSRHQDAAGNYYTAKSANNGWVGGFQVPGAPIAACFIFAMQGIKSGSAPLTFRFGASSDDIGQPSNTVPSDWEELEYDSFVATTDFSNGGYFFEKSIAFPILSGSYLTSYSLSGTNNGQLSMMFFGKFISV